MKKFLLIISFFFTIVSFSYQSTDQPPNVVLIMTDDQGWGDLSINGNDNLSTPNIDRLAESGVSFDRFYVCPLCSPTRAELLTGRYHVRGGVHSTTMGGERIDLDETTILDVFKNAGYSTAAYGKWHNGMQPPYHPNARGVDDFYGFCSGHWGDYFSPMLEHNGKIVKGNGFLVDDFTEHGIQFIEKNKNKPFFLYLPFNTPHGPMQVPDQWWARFENKELKQRCKAIEKEDVSFTRAALAMCENIDWNVGRLMTKIDELGLSENTIIIYLSDNGPNAWRWNGGMKGKKGSIDEGGVRSPMFISWKGNIPSGKEIVKIAGAIDLLPTLADIAGIELQTRKPLDGVSLKKLIFEENPPWNDRMIFSHWGNAIGVRNQKYMLDAGNKLFDIENDPGQLIDISAEEPGILKQLLYAKRIWENNALAELPESDNRPFTIGCPDFEYTQLPARDGVAHGNIKRSNRYPNCSFFTNWISADDKITWEAEVLETGDFEVELYYTCSKEDVGSTIELSFGASKVSCVIEVPHDPPLMGMENDRFKRWNSYVKDFKPLNMGTIHLTKGKGILTLMAKDVARGQVMDFRLLMFKKI